MHARNIDGANPLHHAAFAGRVEAVRLLLQEGADATAQNRHGFMPIDFAEPKGSVAQTLRSAENRAARSNVPHLEGLESEELLEQALDNMRQRRMLKRQVKQKLSMGLDTWRNLRSSMKDSESAMWETAMRMVRRQVVRGWQAWRSVTLERGREKVRFHFVGLWMVQHREKEALRHWQEIRDEASRATKKGTEPCHVCCNQPTSPSSPRCTMHAVPHMPYLAWHCVALPHLITAPKVRGP